MDPRELYFKAPAVNYSEPGVLIRPKKRYRPLVHRTLSFAVIIGVILVLIALIEYGCHRLPHAGWELPALPSAVTLNVRQEPAPPVTSTPSVTITPSVTSTLGDVDAGVPSTTAYYAPPESFLDPSVRTILPPTTVVDAPAFTPPPGTEAPVPSSYLDPNVRTSPVTVGAPPTTFYLAPEVKTLPPTNVVGGPAVETTIAAPLTSGAYNDPAVLTSYPASLPPSAYIDPAVQTTVGGSLPVGAYLDPGVDRTVPASPPSTAILVNGIDNSRPLMTDASGNVLPAAVTSFVSAVPGSDYPNGIITSYTATISGTAVLVVQKASSAASATGYLDPQTSGQATPNLLGGKHGPFTYLTGARYFVGTYLAVFLAVVLRIIVGWLYSATKMLEPFYMLSKPGGALAKDFLTINYLSANDSFEPFTAMLRGHWLMLWTSLLYAFVGLLAPFASELLHFYKYCESYSDGRTVCGPEMWINPAVARILQGFLAFACIMLANIWWLLRKHDSGIYSDPSSIASLATLLHQSEVVDDFRRLPPDISKRDMVKGLADKFYHLGTYRGLDGTERYGLITTSENGATVPGSRYQQLPISTDNGENLLRSSQFETPQKGGNFVLRTLRDTIFIGTIIGILILITYYYKVGTPSGFERFMDSQGFGPRFLITCVGVIIQTQWNRLEREVAIGEPFRRLHAGHAPPELTILVERALTPITSLFSSLHHRSFVVAYVAMVAILAEVLIITLPGIPFDAGQLWKAFILSSYLSMAILAVMLLSLLGLWLRPKGPNLPRTPNTVGAMCSYLCGSSMQDDFADLACVETKTRNRAIKDMGREYALSFGRGFDGVERWRVDYDGYNDTHQVGFA